MKKLAVIFIVAVLIPSIVLAWLAVRSVRDQQLILERQQALLYEGVVDTVVRDLQQRIGEEQSSFVAVVDRWTREDGATVAARNFDQFIRTNWTLASVGFAVTVEGHLLSPLPHSSSEAQMFCADNGAFLSSRESVPVYFNNAQKFQSAAPVAQSEMPELQQQPRNVFQTHQGEQQLSKFAPSETEFRRVIGDSTEGTVARFLENKLNLLVWCRPPGATNLIFGAQVRVEKLVEDLRALVQVDPTLREDICLALLNDSAQPVALSKEGFTAEWKRPFVASEIGEVLPHWEVAAYLVNPDRLSEAAQTARIAFGLLILVLVITIATGGWLIVQDVNRQVLLARQKTDFVSNVSHELKTPLTSIRMFSELLAEGQVKDEEKQRRYLNVITTEASRLTRLINNVLDFARMDRGEKQYAFQPCDLSGLVREVCENFRPQLEEQGFRFECRISQEPVCLKGDPDGLAQVLINLLSNAAKYSAHQKEIEVHMESPRGSGNRVEVKVMDRGIGVPRGCEQRIFEQFFRAHDALDNSTQGAGLGLTLARQIARAHGGEISYLPREGGGSCFVLSLPLLSHENENSDRRG